MSYKINTSYCSEETIKGLVCTALSLIHGVPKGLIIWIFIFTNIKIYCVNSQKIVGADCFHTEMSEGTTTYTGTIQNTQRNYFSYSFFLIFECCEVSKRKLSQLGLLAESLISMSYLVA